MTRQDLLNRIVALKILDAVEPAIWSRFEREAKVLTTLRHRNILQCYSYGVFDNKPYIAMEYVQAITLEKELAGGPLAPARAVLVVRQICQAISSAHAHGVVHRDLKPGNVLLVDTSAEDARLETLFIKVIDFGLAKVLAPSTPGSQSLTDAGCTVGSILYMSPEQCTAGEVDHRTDIYAVGCLLYQCLTGSMPFKAEHSLAIMQQHLYAAIPHLPASCVPVDAQGQLQTIICKAMAKSADSRYQAADDMIEALDGCPALSWDSKALPPIDEMTDTKLLNRSILSQMKRMKAAGVAVIGVVFVLAGIFVFARLSGSNNIVAANADSWILPSPKIEHICDLAIAFPGKNLSRLKEEMDRPHTIVDKTELEATYARCLEVQDWQAHNYQKSDVISFVNEKLRSARDPEETARLYAILGHEYGLNSGAGQSARQHAVFLVQRSLSAFTRLAAQVAYAAFPGC